MKNNTLHIIPTYFRRYLLEVLLVQEIQQVPEALVVPSIRATKQEKFYFNCHDT